MSQHRNSDGTYAKRSKFKAILILVILGVIGFYSYPHVKQFVKNAAFVSTYNQTPQVNATPAPTQEEVKASDIDKRMQEVRTRNEFKSKVSKYEDTEARRIATAEYEKSEADKYAAIKADIEKSKEQVRKNEVSF